MPCEKDPAAFRKASIEQQDDKSCKLAWTLTHGVRQQDPGGWNVITILVAHYNPITHWGVLTPETYYCRGEADCQVTINIGKQNIERVFVRLAQPMRYIIRGLVKGSEAKTSLTKIKRTPALWVARQGLSADSTSEQSYE